MSFFFEWRKLKKRRSLHEMMIRILRCNEVHKADPLFVILPDFFSLLAATTKKIGRFFVQIMELIFSPTYSLGHPSVPSYPSCTVLGFANFSPPILLLLLSLYHFMFTTIYGSEIRGLCLMKWPCKTLQMKTQIRLEMEI